MVGVVVLGFVWVVDGFVCNVLYFGWIDVLLSVLIVDWIGLFVVVGNDVSLGVVVEYLFGVV